MSQPQSTEPRINFVHGAGQHDPERWGQLSVGFLLMEHGRTASQLLRGKLLHHYGPNPEHVGGHRQDTRAA